MLTLAQFFARLRQPLNNRSSLGADLLSVVLQSPDGRTFVAPYGTRAPLPGIPNWPGIEWIEVAEPDPGDNEDPEPLCGAVYADPRGDRPPQDPCGKRRGHENGPETDWKRGYHSNGSLKWPVTDATRRGVVK